MSSVLVNQQVFTFPLIITMDSFVYFSTIQRRAGSAVFLVLFFFFSRPAFPYAEFAPLEENPLNPPPPAPRPKVPTAPSLSSHELGLTLPWPWLWWMVVLNRVYQTFQLHLHLAHLHEILPPLPFAVLKPL